MEEWKDIKGYEGIYQVSNEGRVKSLNYNHTGKERILKSTSNSCDYLNVSLWKDGQKKQHLVHRLVANAFIENPDDLPQVNHIDENKSNNCTENLEWVTCKQNINHGTRNQRMAEAHRGKPCPWATEALTNRTDLSIPINMLTKDGEFIRQFPSSMEAERWLRANGYPKASHCNINSCCQGKRFKSCYGFKWQYTKKELPN